MDKKSIIQRGGSLEKAKKGDYTIDVQRILKEGWRNTMLSRLSINLGLLFIFVIAVIASFLTSNFLGGYEVIIADPQAAIILNVLVTLLIWPFMAGIEMMGVLHAIGIKTKPQLIFAFFKRASWVALCALLTSLLISIGLQLFILPGIFLAVALSLTIPLVVEKQMSPIKAIALSIEALRFQWFKIFSIYMVLVLALMISMLPMVIFASGSLAPVGGVIFFFSMSYLAPWFYNVKGILYREIFGIPLQVIAGNDVDTHRDENKESNDDKNDTFSA